MPNLTQPRDCSVSEDQSAGHAMRISDGEFRAGIKLATEAELASEYRRGVNAVARAMHMLETDGLAKRWPGKGFYSPGDERSPAGIQQMVMPGHPCPLTVVLTWQSGHSRHVPIVFHIQSQLYL
jgi:DNA-binding transcriptional MocR family regulator